MATRNRRATFHAALAALAALACSMPWGARADTVSALHAERMGRLQFMVGNWEGRGWMELAPGQRRDFSQVETVSSKLAGTLLLIEGIGKDRILGSTEEIVTYRGLSVISFDPEAERYRYNGFQFTGRAEVADEVSLVDDTFRWVFHGVPNVGSVRFSIRVAEDGRWLESGEISEDGGASWRKFFAMTLYRTEPR
jgi:hypothetical protein